jgi:hypothetical protein
MPGTSVIRLRMPVTIPCHTPTLRLFHLADIGL